MATIGTANASYYASTSVARVDRANSDSVEKIAKAHQSIADGDRAAFASMNNSFMLDVAATNGALKSMAVTQAYLSTALTAFDNASGILSQMQQLAVLGANGTSNSADAAAIDAEAEALADAFYLTLTEAEYKGKRIFTETETSSKLSFGGRGAQGAFDIDVFDYDNFYDYKAPNTKSLLDGVDYQVARELTDIEKDAILARTSGVSKEDIGIGFTFKTDPSESINVGSGSISILDDVSLPDPNNNAENSVIYRKADQDAGEPVRIDTGAKVQAAGDFNGGSVQFTISDNWETSDVISLFSTDDSDIFFRDDGEVVYRTTIEGFDYEVEIGKIDNELNGLNGKPLEINLYSDATIPAREPYQLENGDFEKAIRVQGGVPFETYTQGEHRDGIVESYTVTSGTGYVAANDTASTGLGRGSDTFSVTFETDGSGTGFRANLAVDNSGGISIVEVLDSGKDYEDGDVLTLSEGSLGEGDVGANFAVVIDMVVDSDPPGTGANNIQDVTTPTFNNDVNVFEEETQTVVYEWGERREDNQLRKVIADQGDAGATLDFYRSEGETVEPNLGDLGGTNISSVLGDGYTVNIDDDTLTYSDQAIIFDRVEAVSNMQAEMVADTERFIAVYETDETGAVKVETSDTELSGSEPVTSVQRIEIGAQQDGDEAQYGTAERVDVDAYDPGSPGVRYTAIPGDRETVSVAEYEANVGTYYSQNSNSEWVPVPIAEKQDGDRPVTDGFERIAIGAQEDGDTPIYEEWDSDGRYDWGEEYQEGVRKKISTGYAADGNGDSTYVHTESGSYDWAVNGFYLYADDDSFFSRNYFAGQNVLEVSDTGGAGWREVKTFSEVPETAFYVRDRTLNTQNVIEAYQRDNVVSYEREEITSYDVERIIGYDKQEVTHYNREVTDGYERDKVAFYLEERTLFTKYVAAGQVNVYTGEDVDETALAHTGWDRDEESFIPNWTKYNNQVFFGDDFTITDTENGTLIESNVANGQYADNSRQVEIPTPQMADMLTDPAYQYTYTADDLAVINGGRRAGDTVTASAQVQGRDDFTVEVRRDGSVELVDRATDGAAGSGVKLDTGEVLFADGNEFGVYHGPAIVSDVFTARKDQYLKLDFSAFGENDDYHVTGYIYNVNEEDPELHIAIGDTGKEADSRKSVEVPEDGEYRFVFIVGSYDKTGGKLAGADMTIDNIVVEDPYRIQQDALTALAQAVQYNKTGDTTESNPLKVLTTKISNGMAGENEVTLFDETNIEVTGYDQVRETNGPYAILPSYDLVTRPSDAASSGSSALTSKIETVHEQLRTARIKAATSYVAIDAAMANITDLRSQYTMGSNTISSLNFTKETAYLSKIQIQQDVAAAMLAQANKAQEGLLSLI